MKKQILALMASAAVFATGPAFAMLKEDTREPEGSSFQALPLDPDNTRIEAITRPSGSSTTNNFYLEDINAPDTGSVVRIKETHFPPGYARNLQEWRPGMDFITSDGFILASPLPFSSMTIIDSLCRNPPLPKGEQDNNTPIGQSSTDETAYSDSSLPIISLTKLGESLVERMIGNSSSDLEIADID
jgi:hypothetical protein